MAFRFNYTYEALQNAISPWVPIKLFAPIYKLLSDSGDVLKIPNTIPLRIASSKTGSVPQKAVFNKSIIRKQMEANITEESMRTFISNLKNSFDKDSRITSNIADITAGCTTSFEKNKHAMIKDIIANLQDSYQAFRKELHFISFFSSLQECLLDAPPDAIIAE